MSSSSFLDIFNSLDSSAQKRGYKFESVCKWWLANDPFWSQEFIHDSIKLWQESPHRTGPDIGIDLTALDKLGNVWAIQVKGWDPKAALPKKEIDKFLVSSSTKTFTKRLLITTTNSISINAKRAIGDQEKPVVVVSLQDLEDSDVWPLFDGDLRKRVREKPRQLLPHQETAKKHVLQGLASAERGQLIMACGSGKTLTAQRINEGLNSKATLVLLPSLLLLQQTLNSWRRDSLSDFTSLCVCSDMSVANDESLAKTQDLPFPVTTAPDEIENFLKLPGRKVVFSTYQSSERISQALANSKFSFDFVICDEAHRLAGKVDKSFGIVLEAGAIPARKLLFMTATPKIFKVKDSVAEGSDEIETNSMDDEVKFGSVLYKFSFAEAIEKNILTDYRVIVIGVSDTETKNLITNRTLIDFGNQEMHAELIGAHYGLAKAFIKHSMKRVISFHSRVDKAAEFAQFFPIVLEEIHETEPQIFSRVISGKDPSSKRKQTLSQLKELANYKRGLVTNARCLTEGVDVPSLDAIAFIDARTSQVDIVQAIGRAIRKGGEEKKLGYIVIPVFLGPSDQSDVQIESSRFKAVWEVINALKSHDATLEEEIVEIRRELGRLGEFKELPSKIVFDLPGKWAIDFKHKLETLILEKISTSWEEYFAKLIRFAEVNGHCRPKREYSSEEESRLASWTMKQRGKFNKGKMSLEKIKLLEGVPHWTWDPFDTQWMEYFERLSKYTEVFGTSQVPSTYRDEDGRPLGKWAAKLRSKSEVLRKEQIELLSSLPNWTWDPFQDQWNLAYEEIKKKAEERGHTTFSRTDKFSDGRSIGGWVIKQRQWRDELSIEKRKLLESLPRWTWDPYEELKRDTKRELLNFAKHHGHTRVPQDYESASGMKLGLTVARLRRQFAKGQLDTEWIEFIGKLPGWQWNKRTEDWQERLDLLTEFVSKHNRLPKGDEVFKDEKIGWWVHVQRQFFKKGSISDQKKLLLENVPYWTWDVYSEKWQQGFDNLVRFLKTNNGRPPRDKEKTAEGFGVGAWVYNQRERFSRLTPEQQEKLGAFAWFKPLIK
jgi:superfamily II DNA or RNA helicase